MMEFEAFIAFMRRYFPIFALGFFTSLLSIAMAVVVWVDHHWRRDPDYLSYSMAVGGVLVLVLCVGHFVMIRGLGWAIWAVLPVPIATLLMALSVFGSGVNAVLLASALALPLLALLAFNSMRHRQMRQRLVALRRERKSV
ncbi:hypothetical protein P0Y43_01155 [Pseudomonas entomophila]|uniref:hypothetical protein n=1 Tax=Pseudomonas entomophila TaxID=312306 RepID=UPI0023D8C3B2|nr:hypothetical protein [Pseudomonas entomophila]MDF0729331.1 hypothetical protein [Pseudomonas entomophila]